MDERERTLRRASELALGYLDGLADHPVGARADAAAIAGRLGADPRRAVLEVGGGQSPQHLVNEFAATIAAVSPTPGGLGAMEAALVAALTRLGVEAGSAVAAALTFRLVTFWLPLPVGGWALRTGRKSGWL